MSVPTSAEPPETKFDPKVVRVYKAVGKLLNKYRSGKMPKALKILPRAEVPLGPVAIWGEWRALLALGGGGGGSSPSGDSMDLLTGLR